jgi:tetratricopeptide (TPR) repeat protein
MAWAEVSQSVLEKAEALMKSSQAEEAYKMLEPLEVEGAGDLVYDYLLGTAALESNRPSKATFVYERILAVDPSYVGVRADMGRAYFALGDYGRAKIEFETVLAFQNLPQDLRSSVEQYAKAAEARAQNKRTVATGYVELGFGNDSNIGSATALSSLTLPSSGAYSPVAPGVKTPDNYSTLGLGGEVNHQIDEKWGVYLGGDFRGRAYQTFYDSGNYTVDLRGGASYSGGAWLVRAGLTAGGYYLNHAHLRDSVGANVDWRLALNNASQVTLGGSVVRATYVPAAQSAQDTQSTTLSTGWLTSLGDGSTVLGISVAGGVESAIGNRDDGDKQFWGPRIFLQKSFTEKIGGYVTTGITAAKYSGINSLYLLSRDENMVDVALGLTWSVAKGVSIRPQVTYVKNTSNAELYSYDKTDISINGRIDF